MGRSLEAKYHEKDWGSLFWTSSRIILYQKSCICNKFNIFKVDKIEAGARFHAHISWKNLKGSTKTFKTVKQ